MSFVPMIDLVGRAFRDGYAVPSFCTWDAQTIELILRTAEKLQAPVIVMQGPGEFPVLGPGSMARAAHAMKEKYPIPAALHLDHGSSMEMVRECLDAGYTSVMLDFSARSFAENSAALKEVCRLAHPLGITVEGEIGRIGKADEVTTEGSERTSYSDPGEALAYTLETGVDLLAVSIGNKHGFYRGDPHLEFGLLAELHAAVPVPLVLHGGTGIPEKDIQRAIGLGIAKVNVASELIHAFRKSLSSQWESGRNLWAPEAIGEALPEMGRIAARWIRALGAEGKAC